jgi:hypothetical protein
METQIVLNNLNPLLSKVDWWRKYIHLRSLNLNHFQMVDTTGLKFVESRSPSMILPAQQT